MSLEVRVNERVNLGKVVGRGIAGGSSVYGPMIG